MWSWPYKTCLLVFPVIPSSLILFISRPWGSDSKKKFFTNTGLVSTIVIVEALVDKIWAAFSPLGVWNILGDDP